MKRSFLRLLGVLCIIGLLSNCKKNNSDPTPNTTITSFTPSTGVVGTTVTITGTNYFFDSSFADNVVKFNGVAATVTAATATQITVVVPPGATTGKITVSAHARDATSSTDFTVLAQPVITDFDPSSAVVGTNIVISGNHFATATGENAVAFNGVQASVMTASETQLTVAVPATATTGKVTVTVNGLVATSTNDFIILSAPTLVSVDPAFYQTGTTLPTITITGTNFSAVTTDNVVKFNGTEATVTSATDTQLLLTLPEGVTSGKISVTVHGVTVNSATDFLVGCPDGIISDMTVTSIDGNYLSVTFHIKNVGTIPLDLSEMFIQAYVGTAASTSTPGVQTQAAGGFAKFGCCGNTEPLLQPNEVREKILTSVNGNNYSITTYPYVIFDLLPEVDGPVECNASNNELGVKIQ